MISTTLSHFRILDRLGEGGMGVVYRALDTRLERTVALKVLRPEAIDDPDRKRRFILEARAASALNHPNIVTIYDIDSAEGVDFIAMEHLDGESLAHRLVGGALPMEAALRYSREIAAALGAAHAAGIVHRDVKPGNVMITRAGVVKVLDFGLAKRTGRAGLKARQAGEPDRPDASTEAFTRSLEEATAHGVVLGTIAYMSPEQAEGKSTDARSDVFSAGGVIYEMLTGRRPFQGDSDLATLTAILRDRPAPPTSVCPGLPPELEAIVLRCLEKDLDARYASAADLFDDLTRFEARQGTGGAPARPLAVRARFVVPALALVLAVAAGIGWWWFRSSGPRWAREVAIPEVARLLDQEQYGDALRLAREAERYLPADPQILRLVRGVSLPLSIRTEPPGAQILTKEYLAVDARWEPLGVTPIQDVRVPLVQLRVRVAKDGFEPVEVALFSGGAVDLTLDRVGSAPDGMVRVPRGAYRFGSSIELADYWIDKYEVTNRQYKKFVDAGGYDRREYWRHPFVKDGREISWDAAMHEFQDATGRPAPSTWLLGTYPKGSDDLPVGGVSWHEAAAYAAFAGKSLPTVYHWYRAAIGVGVSSDILKLSNFGGQGPARVGSFQGLGEFGTYDMAGNVKEWCWNQTGGRRVIRGGAWNDASYLSYQDDALTPFDRSPTNGFRSVIYPTPVPDELTRPVDRLTRDYSREQPVGDDVFRAYRGLYAYSRTALNASVKTFEERDDWRAERVSFDAAYGNERVIALLFLPRSAVPPYQTVVYFPSSFALISDSVDAGEMLFVDFLVKSGRAVMYPIYRGTYERRQPNQATGSQLEREMMTFWSKDLGRSIDYLETRDDIDTGRLAFYGFSLGARYGPLLTALEPRLKVSVLLAGGFSTEPLAPEVDPMHFAPRATIPVLMLNGRDDFMRPVDVSQAPMFRLLGAPAANKRHLLFDSGHVPPRVAFIRETLAWLDRYLGPVPAQRSSAR